MKDTDLTLQASPLRRWLGILSIAVIGVTMIYLAAAYPPDSVILLILLPVLGLGFLWLAYRNYVHTGGFLYLTEDHFGHSVDGVLCELGDITRVERGLFAFKPTGGFVLHCCKPVARRWRPGIYWAFGYRIGVGGVIHRNYAKMVAEAIAVKIEER